MDEIRRKPLCAAYVLLGGTSAYALKQAISSSSTYSLGTFGFLLGHSLLGIAYTALENRPRIIKIMYHQTEWLVHLVPLALLNTELYTLTNFPPTYAYAHLASPILPYGVLLIVGDMDDRMGAALDVAVVANLASMGYLPITKQTGIWNAGLILSYALNHFEFGFFADLLKISDSEVTTFGLVLFTVFAMKSLKEI